jgi:TPR repeat protein
MIQAFRYYKGIGHSVNYPRALRLYLQAAKGGDPEAQLIVGGMYFKGQGTDSDQRKAFKWLLRAAQQGTFSPESLAIIGSMYLQGTGVPQNYREAREYLEHAADLGDLSAKKNLAFMNYNGLVGKVDFPRALELYKEAALQGDNAAQNNVGLMYVNGLGADVDRVQAYAWYSLAASQGNTGSMIARNNLMIQMSWEELNRAQALSVTLFKEVELFRKSLPDVQ